MAQIRNTKLLKKIALVIKQIRETKKLTQEQVLLDTSIHIARIETASVNVSVSTLSALCEYFKVPMSEFFKRIENL